MTRDIVVIGASFGGIQAVSLLLSELPGDFPASVFVVVHLFPSQPSSLPGILSRAGELEAIHPKDRQRFGPGRVYVAPPDKHMMIEGNRIRVLRSPKENMHRPAIDPLFRTAAFFCRRRVVGILLTGADSDGTSGLFSIKLKGGLAIVQDPDEAAAPTMPFSAMSNLKVDRTLPVKEISRLLPRIVFATEPSVRG